MSDFEWPDPVEGMRALDAASRAIECGADPVDALADYEDERQDQPRDESKTVDGYEIASCRSCWAPIVWAHTHAGDRMPVDAEIVPDGNVVLSKVTRISDGKVDPIATVLDQASLFADGPRRKSHFATCPDSSSWRKTR